MNVNEGTDLEKAREKQPSRRWRLLQTLLESSLVAVVSAVLIFGILLVDALHLFVATSYWLAWGLFAFLSLICLAFLRHRQVSVAAKRTALPAWIVLTLITVLLPGLNDPERKAFYRAYRQIEPRMRASEAVELLADYPMKEHEGDRLQFTCVVNPSTVDFISLSVESDRIAAKRYLWD